MRRDRGGQGPALDTAAPRMMRVGQASQPSAGDGQVLFARHSVTRPLDP